MSSEKFKEKLVAHQCKRWVKLPREIGFGMPYNAKAAPTNGRYDNRFQWTTQFEIATQLLFKTFTIGKQLPYGAILFPTLNTQSPLCLFFDQT